MAVVNDTAMAPAVASSPAPLDVSSAVPQLVIRRRGGTAQSICSTCGKEGEGGRCKSCGAFSVRLHRFLATRSEEYKCTFTNIFAPGGSMTKAEFTAEASKLFGTDLAKFVDKTVSEYCVNSTEVSLKGTGEFLDLQDLRDRYAAKPLRLAAIEKNARRFTCPISETEFIEDMSYTSSIIETHKRVLEECQKCSRDTEKVKRIKVEKPKAIEAPEGAAAADGQTGGPPDVPAVKPLTAKQVEQVSKWKGEISPLVAKVQACQDEVNHDDNKDWKGYFPDHVHALFNSLKLKMTNLENDWDIVLDTENTNQNIEFKKLNDAWKEFKGELKEVKRKYDVQMKEAKSMARGGA